MARVLNASSEPAPSVLRARRIGAARATRWSQVGLLLALASALLVGCGPSGPTGVPEVPREVMAAAAPGGVRVTWVDQSSSEDGFVIFRKDAGEQGPPSLEVGRVTADEQTYVDFSTADDGSYLYGVAAFNVIGPSDVVLQDPAEPVSPLPGLDVSLTFDGDGVVTVSGAGLTRVCVTDCLVSFAAGTRITLTAASSEGAVFAGWAGACSGAGACELELTEPLEIEARFRLHVLQLELDGDSPVELTMYPADDFGNSKCVLGASEACALAYGFAGPLAVSINAVKLDPAGKFLGYDGPCSTEQGSYCLANVAGETAVRVSVIRPPVAKPDAYPLNEDQLLEKEAGAGVLSNDDDSADDRLSAVVTANPAHGTLEMRPNGSFEYAPDEDYNGTDAFEYLTRDAYGNESEIVSVGLTVRAVNDPPVFALNGDPPATFGTGNQVTRAGFATAIGPGGGPDEDSQELSAFTVIKKGGGLNAMLTPQISPAGQLSYTPPAQAIGTATYQVTLSDDGGTANGGSDTSPAQEFTITVSGVQLTVVEAVGGSVSRSPAAADGRYGFGATVTLTAVAAEGHSFASWGGACGGSVATCHLEMDGDKTVTARFDPLVTIRFAEGAPGLLRIKSTPAAIDCMNLKVSTTGTCVAPFQTGSQVALRADGSDRFLYGGAACSEPEPSNTCTFTITAPVSVEVDSSE